MTDATVPAPALPGVFARALGIITSPRATFEKIVPNPPVLGIVALVALLMGVCQATFQFTAKGQQAYLDMQVQQTEKFTGHPVTDQQYAGMQKMAPIQAYISAGAFFVVLPVGLLLFSAVMWVIFNALLGGTADFKQVTAVCAHAMVISALGYLYALPMNFIRGTVNTSPAPLSSLFPMLPEGSFFTNFLGFIDLFSLWGLIVTSIGLSVLYKRKAANIAIGLFSFWVVIALSVAYFITK